MDRIDSGSSAQGHFAGSGPVDFAQLVFGVLFVVALDSREISLRDALPLNPQKILDSFNKAVVISDIFGD